jgi:Sec-independent protein translocase protein TatA
MLVRFTSSTSGAMIMFANHAHDLFEVIGKECTARGVFVTEQLPTAIAQLQHAVEAQKQAEKQAEKQAAEALRANPEQDSNETDKDAENRPGEKITLVQRAHPLIHLMQQTLKEDGFILWEAERDF